MRYGAGSGVDQGARVRRGRVGGPAGQMSAAGRSAAEVAGLLEVSTKSAYQWRRAWAAGGARALVSKGPSGPDRNKATTWAPQGVTPVVKVTAKGAVRV